MTVSRFFRLTSPFLAARVAASRASRSTSARRPGACFVREVTREAGCAAWAGATTARKRATPMSFFIGRNWTNATVNKCSPDLLPPGREVPLQPLRQAVEAGEKDALGNVGLIEL